MRIMNKFPIKFTRKLLQEQTVYLESEHDVEDIVDWFENSGLPRESSHRYRHHHEEIVYPPSVELMKVKLTEDGWGSQTGHDFNSGLRPIMDDVYLYECDFENVRTPEGFVDECDEPIRKYLIEKPKIKKKELLKELRGEVKKFDEDWSDYKRSFENRLQYLSEMLTTKDYSEMDKSEKKIVDDFYKVSPFKNPLDLVNYK